MSANLEKEAAYEAGGPGFLKRQLMTFPKRVPDSIRLDGQTAIITGSSGGLGLEAMRQLLGLGLSRGILAVRSQAKGDAAAAELRKQFPAAQVDVWLLDMASYDSISAFAARCEAELPRLDVAILNAGVQTAAFQRDPATGHEMMLQVNYLSTVLLAVLLVPVFRAKRAARGGRPGRLTIVSSDTAHWATLAARGPVFERFDKEDGFVTFDRYRDSKLLVIAATRELARHVDPADVVVNTANPGLVHGTDLQRDSNLGFVLDRLVVPFFKKALGRNVVAGASTYIDAAVVQGPESHGSYCSDWTIKPYPAIMYTEEGKELSQQLWTETIEGFKRFDIEKALAGMRS